MSLAVGSSTTTSSRGVPSGLEDAVDKTGLALDVALTVARISRRELALQFGVRCGHFGVRAKVVAEGQVVAPERAADRREMDVILSRLATSEKIATRYSLLASVDVGPGPKRRDRRYALGVAAVP